MHKAWNKFKVIAKKLLSLLSWQELPCGILGFTQVALYTSQAHSPTLWPVFWKAQIDRSGSFFLENQKTEALRVEPSCEISANGFLQVIWKMSGARAPPPFVSKLAPCSKIFAIFFEISFKIRQNLNLAPKLKTRFLSWIGRQKAFKTSEG